MDGHRLILGVELEGEDLKRYMEVRAERDAMDAGVLERENRQRHTQHFRGDKLFDAYEASGQRVVSTKSVPVRALDEVLREASVSWLEES